MSIRSTSRTTCPAICLARGHIVTPVQGISCTALRVCTSTASALELRGAGERSHGMPEASWHRTCCSMES
jgi:hypothetical protein